MCRVQCQARGLLIVCSALPRFFHHHVRAADPVPRIPANLLRVCRVVAAERTMGPPGAPGRGSQPAEVSTVVGARARAAEALQRAGRGPWLYDVGLMVSYRFVMILTPSCPRSSCWCIGATHGAALPRPAAALAEAPIERSRNASPLWLVTVRYLGAHTAAAWRRCHVYQPRAAGRCARPRRCTIRRGAKGHRVCELLPPTSIPPTR